MRIHNVHERVIAPDPCRIAQLVGDFSEIWPEEIAPAPRRLADGLYDAGPMVWQEIERGDATRAFRVTSPSSLEAEHWFELRPLPKGTLVRHVVSGEAHDAFAAVWRNRLEPIHDRTLEALLDRIAAGAVTSQPSEGSWT